MQDLDNKLYRECQDTTDLKILVLLDGLSRDLCVDLGPVCLQTHIHNYT